ncbi:MAG: zinc ABC transporter substrate-binding protein [Firmicutes bacterium]|nr:zinc ABC transporter substrate-binding protein [Bacillota bacterium]
MKKTISGLLVLAMLLACLSGCGSAKTEPAKSTDSKLNIVTTIFPIYDWTRNITAGSDSIELSLLLDNGTDLHSYQPTAADILKISSCDLFIYVGGESDKWVEDVLSQAINKDIKAISLLDVLGSRAKTEESVEGMEESGDEEEEEEYDEHVWLSVRNAEIFTGYIADVIAFMEGDKGDMYKYNGEDYITKLEQLDKDCGEMTAKARFDTLLFGDRFPFRYLVDDYNLKYYAAFSGCSAESEASFKTVAFLSGKLDELGLPAILTLEDSDKKLADTIVQNTKSKDYKVLTLDSMQHITSSDISNGIDYITVMENNLEVLREALN